jgi:hypothetical protein
MCPICAASAAVVAGSVVPIGSLSALAVKIFRCRKTDKLELRIREKEKE